MAILVGLLLAIPFSADGPNLADESAETSQLKHAFSDAKGKVRIMLIVSPG
jgi:hypothetical protein